MIVTKDIDYITLIKVRGKNMLWLLAFMGIVALLYHFKIVTINIPWLPVSVIGTAVAFYVGLRITKLMIECGKRVKFGEGL